MVEKSIISTISGKKKIDTVNKKEKSQASKKQLIPPKAIKLTQLKNIYIYINKGLLR